MERDDMASEYDLRGGIRGKYYLHPRIVVVSATPLLMKQDATNPLRYRFWLTKRVGA